MKKVFLLTSFLSIIFFSVSSSNSAEYWDVTYGGSYDDFVSSIQQTTDGGYIVAGTTNSFGGYYDVWVLKLDETGNVSWQKTYGGTTDGDYASSIQQTTDGGYIVTGRTFSFGPGISAFWILKLDSVGNVLWQKTYGGNGRDEASSIRQTTDGGYVVTGYTESFGAGRENFWVLKLDETGNVSWQKTYGGNGRDGATSIQQTTDGGYVVLGYTYSFGAGYEDLLVLKLDETGNVSWQKTYGGGSTAEYPSSIQLTTDGGYVVVTPRSKDYLILKIDSFGNIQWQKTYGGRDWESASSIQQTTDGGYIVATSYSEDYHILKIDSFGDIQWQKTYGGSYRDIASSIQQTTDGGYIVAGNTRSFRAGQYDIWVLKLDEKGEIPDCNIMDISNVIINDSSSISKDVTCTVQTSSAYIVETTAVPQDTSAELNTVCTSQIDADEDGILSYQDNCPHVANPGQEDIDGDNFGDVCDNCPSDNSSDQENSDNDNFGDVCDNCPYVTNPDQEDSDGDDIGDICDNCPDIAYSGQEDSDRDGLGNICDNCPDIANPDQEDLDGDSFGNACDEDDDNDEILDTADNCPEIVNPDQNDYDKDGVGDACDNKPIVFNPFPIADGHYAFSKVCPCSWGCGIGGECHTTTLFTEHGITMGSRTYTDGPGGYKGINTFDICISCYEETKTGIVEFDISNIEGIYSGDQIQASLTFIVKEDSLKNDSCLLLYSILDENENGIIELTDVNTSDYLGEICSSHPLQPFDTISFDVTSALEHDLSDSNQSDFSGFVLKTSEDASTFIEFYDHTDPENGPRLSVSSSDCTDKDIDGYCA